MKTIILGKGSKSINAEKIVTMVVSIEDKNGEDFLLNNPKVKNIANIPDKVLKTCKKAKILCHVSEVDVPLCLVESENVKDVIEEYIAIQYFLNQPEYTEINYDVNYDEGEIDDMVFFNQYFIHEND